MQESRLLAVGFVDFVLVRRGRNAQEIVECYSWPLGEFDFIAQTEDFLICGLQLAIGFYPPCRAPKCDGIGRKLAFFAPCRNYREQAGQDDHSKEWQPHIW
jgi:hypothetical protein